MCAAHSSGCCRRYVRCRALLEQGPSACLALLPGALDSLAAFMDGGPLPLPVPVLRARILAVAAASPLLPWALQLDKPAPPTPATQQQQQQQGNASQDQQNGEQRQNGEQQASQQQEVAAAAAAAAALVQAGRPATPAASPLSKPSPRRLPPGSAPVGFDGLLAAVGGGCARSYALLELLQELQTGCQLAGQRRQAALVAGSAESVRVLQRLLAGAEQLACAEVCLLADALAGGANGAAHHGGSSDGEGPAANGVPEAAEEAEAAAPAAPEEAAPAEAEAVEAEAADAEAAAAGEPGADAGEAGEAAQEREAADGLARARSAEVAAAWARAAPPTARTGKLVVHLLSVGELPELEERIADYRSLVW